MANIQDEIEQKIAKVKRDGEDPLKALNRVLGEAIEEREDLSQTTDAQKAREALRDPNKSMLDADVDFERTSMTDR